MRSRDSTLTLLMACVLAETLPITAARSHTVAKLSITPFGPPKSKLGLVAGPGPYILLHLLEDLHLNQDPTCIFRHHVVRHLQARNDTSSTATSNGETPRCDPRTRWPNLWCCAANRRKLIIYLRQWPACQVIRRSPQVPRIVLHNLPSQSAQASCCTAIREPSADHLPVDRQSLRPASFHSPAFRVALGSGIFSSDPS